MEKTTMIELVNKEKLLFRFPELHRNAECEISFVRCDCVPKSAHLHDLPKTHGLFDLDHVNDFQDWVPSNWLDHGGVMFPVRRTEAVMLRFFSPKKYPFAVKVGSSKKCVLTGQEWTETLVQGKSIDKAGVERSLQNYLVVPGQDCLAGFQISTEEVRQFVAQPLKQTSSDSSLSELCGGIQIEVFPIDPEIYERILDEKKKQEASKVLYCLSYQPDMYITSGGHIAQRIVQDPHSLSDYRFVKKARVFVHLVDAEDWPAEEKINSLLEDRLRNQKNSG